MSYKFDITDNQYFNFICGLNAGLKLKDLTLPAVESSIVLNPIGVAGEGTIGIMLPKILYDGVNRTGLIPVVVHDVNIGYSGFSVNIRWDSSRLQFNGVEVGEFGTISDGTKQTDIRYTYVNGEFKAKGIRNKNIVFKKPIVLFYISVTILGDVTVDNPISLNLVDSSFTDLEYTTLLTWVEIDKNVWYNFFITPLKNVSGAIISNIESSGENGELQPSNKGTLGDSKVVAAKGSPSCVTVGVAYTIPGHIGVCPIFSNSSTEDAFEYNRVRCKILVKDEDGLFEYIDVVGAGDFKVSTIKSINNGYIELDIDAVRDKSLIDSVTFCYIKYRIKMTLDKYIINLSNEYSSISDRVNILDVDKQNGQIYYAPGISNNFNNGNGGISGSGEIWSSCEQTIWISAGGVKYPIYLKPGSNIVRFWIPNIFPEDTYIEEPIVIETYGYILIPAGFEWSIITGEDAPVKLGNKKYSDKLSFIDSYDIELITPQKPIDLDGIVDEIGFDDSHNIEIETPQSPIKHSENTDEFEFNDDCLFELINTPKKYEFGVVDISEFDDDVNINLISITPIDNVDSNVDRTIFDDSIDIDI